jgi:predicted RNase H-like nuclease
LEAGDLTIAGVDGCRAGWIAVVCYAGRSPEITIFRNFADLVTALPINAVIAVDMPIGLPDISLGGGRIAERSARSVLKRRKSSVFSIPSRSAVYLEQGEFDDFDARKVARSRVSAHAKLTSQPPRGVTFQAFSIFPKIRDIDLHLRSDISLRSRVLESHPEVAFWQLNNECEMQSGKKTNEGVAERKAVLAAHGMSSTFLELIPTSQAAAVDDFLDACAMFLVAARRARGEARPLPDPPSVDAYGIPIAIWV